MNKLLKYSQQLHTDAKQVIELTDFIKIFSVLGKVVFTGSFETDLLYRRDIDVFILSDICSKSQANNLTKELIDSNTFQTVGYADWTVERPANMLNGIYWQLVYYYKGDPWKFDVWYTKEEVKTIKNTEIIKQRLLKNSAARLEILQLKEKLFDGEKYHEDMNGFKIYERILGKI